jgi:hypothetical protein
MRNEATTCPWSLVAIHWLDAFDGDNGWTDIEKYDPSATTVVSVGFLWPDCLQGYVTLVSSYMPDEVPDMLTTSNPVHIPTGMVLDIVLLSQPAFSYSPEQPAPSQTLHAPSLGHPQTQEKFHNVSNHHRAHH